ncbi:XRE family transcriptional regulator [Jiangella aurantiaca]|uniref:XRE family transcriptional regulator n=1 Tax=Jiangella aurantiaca TaxID=2530373 RepID=A0A4R5AIB8_9ACTN|nr:helix-turn-helix transcriptional regulator [Jiangella aurantiaca]TDD70714.1 XRE family transcriptional regulator [Jiangella aurantiaca]
MTERRALPADWPALAVKLGDRLRAARGLFKTDDGRKLSQEQLAHLAKISRNHIQNIENARNNARDGSGNPQPGPGNPGLATLLAISRALEIELLDLLPDELLPPAIRDRPWRTGQEAE